MQISGVYENVLLIRLLEDCMLQCECVYNLRVWKDYQRVWIEIDFFCRW